MNELGDGGRSETAKGSQYKCWACNCPLSISSMDLLVADPTEGKGTRCDVPFTRSTKGLSDKGPNRCHQSRECPRGRELRTILPHGRRCKLCLGIRSWTEPVSFPEVTHTSDHASRDKGTGAGVGVGNVKPPVPTDFWGRHLATQLYQMFEPLCRNMDPKITMSCQ